MELTDAIPAIESLAFVAGLAAIHGLRRHADAVTACLVGVAATLVLAVAFAATPTGVYNAYGAALADPSSFIVETF